MTDHDLGIRTREDTVTTPDPRLMAPPDTLATDSLATDDFATDSYATPQPMATQTSARYARADDDRVTVRTQTAGPRLDRIRWSSIRAGLAVALAIYLFLQLALVATGIGDLAQATSSDAWWSAGAALVAFLVGGIVAGATAV